LSHSIETDLLSSHKKARKVTKKEMQFVSWPSDVVYEMPVAAGFELGIAGRPTNSLPCDGIVCAEQSRD